VRLVDIDEFLAAPLRRQGVQVRVRLEPDLDLDDAGRLTVYRIVQEALTNVSRHARARQVWVEVARRPGSLLLSVSDDGIGMGDGAPRSGLLGVRERVQARHGRLEISPRPGGGTTVAAVLPVPS